MRHIPLSSGKCDSCEEDSIILLPIAVLEELPSGGVTHVIKYYCITCYKDRIDVEDLPEPPEGPT